VRASLSNLWQPRLEFLGGPSAPRRKASDRQPRSGVDPPIYDRPGHQKFLTLFRCWALPRLGIARVLWKEARLVIVEIAVNRALQF
jgi:hypothetical protein